MFGQQIENMITTGVVVESQSAEGKALVRVEFEEDCISDWMPCVAYANAFMTIWIPINVGEQVTVLREGGEIDAGIAIPSIHHIGAKEATGASDKNFIIEFRDGNSLKYEDSIFTFTATEVIINGNLKVNGTITDNIGTLSDHTHIGVTAGSVKSGGRQ
jgi:phage baseplate assembly protein V